MLHNSAPPDPLAGVGGFVPLPKNATPTLGPSASFSLYLSIRGLRKGPGKFIVGVLEVLDFLSVRVGTLFIVCAVLTLYCDVLGCAKTVTQMQFLRTSFQIFDQIHLVFGKLVQKQRRPVGLYFIPRGYVTFAV